MKSRFAPSPTGSLHIGGVRTALFAWLAVKGHNTQQNRQGKFVVRIEDTDKERSTQASTQLILDSLAWLGIHSDEDIVYQSNRTARYQEAIDYLLANQLAYHCYASKEELDVLREQQKQRGEKPRYDGRYRDFQGEPPAGITPVVRFKNPQEGTVVFQDAVRGEITVANRELDDLIIMRSDGTPTYNFCVVVDDSDMGISHVIRGDDHINNTPRQINIGRALDGLVGYQQPSFAHLPMVLGDDGNRLSKRHGANSVLDYQRLGYLPDALLNYLARLGWSHGNQELFSRDELLQVFSLSHISVSPASFSLDKLLWVNQQHILMADLDRLSIHIKALSKVLGDELDYSFDGYDEVYLQQAIDMVREKHKTLVEIATAIRYFFVDITGYDEKVAKKHIKDSTRDILQALRKKLNGLEGWQADDIKHCVHAVAEKFDTGMGKVGMPFRLALTGGGQSPAIEAVAQLLGKTTTLQRIDSAIDHFFG